MKISICSDLHIEFEPIELVNKENADVLILSGDICVASEFSEEDNAESYHKFFSQCSEQFKDVVYVLGNHEHYNGDFGTTTSILKESLRQYPNVHVLDKESVRINEFLFIGGTLWTDMNKQDPLAIHAAMRGMHDYNYITNKKIQSYNSRTKFHPVDSIEYHYEMVKYIKTMSETEDNVIVVSHHTPSTLSCHPKFGLSNPMNWAYHSNLENFILERPQIKLWTHGHTHEYFDYDIGETRVVCNPRGYQGYEPIANYFELKTIDLSPNIP